MNKVFKTMGKNKYSLNNIIYLIVSRFKQNIFAQGINKL